MDDRFMNELRRDPDPNFTHALRAKLGEQAPSPVMRALRPVPALAFAALAAAVISLFVFPEARVSAQAMLDLFRVRKFSAIQFDESRLEKLKSFDDENALMVFDEKEILLEPGPVQVFLSAEEAGAAAGMTLKRPSWLPKGMTADTVLVKGAAAARLSVSEEKLRALLDALALSDVAVPEGIDGQPVEVRKHPTAVQQFRSGRWKAALVQSKSPEMSVPAGLEIEKLAEVGLRVLGLDAGEAHRVAQNTDWRSTLVVPVPLNASTFRQVTVGGNPGLMITMKGEKGTDSDRLRDGSVVMWSEGDMVFGLLTNMGPDDALPMAESVK